MTVTQHGIWRAIHFEVDVVLTAPEKNAPSKRGCRFAVLPLGKLTEPGRTASVIYDRVLNRIVDGVYYGNPVDVLPTAQHFNEHPDRAYPDNPFLMRAPNGDALGLLYPGRDDPHTDDDEE